MREVTGKGSGRFRCSCAAEGRMGVAQLDSEGGTSDGRAREEAFHRDRMVRTWSKWWGWMAGERGGKSRRRWMDVLASR